MTGIHLDFPAVISNLSVRRDGDLSNVERSSVAFCKSENDVHICFFHCFPDTVHLRRVERKSISLVFFENWGSNNEVGRPRSPRISFEIFSIRVIVNAPKRGVLTWNEDLRETNDFGTLRRSFFDNTDCFLDASLEIEPYTREEVSMSVSSCL